MKGSRKEERLLILNMVQEGKISVEESLKLLEALNGPAAEDDYYNYYSYDFEEKFNKFSDSVDSFAKEVGEKVSVTFKDMEPKLKNATKTVVEKTVGVLGDITNSLNETLKNMERDFAPKACDEPVKEPEEAPADRPVDNDNNPI